MNNKTSAKGLIFIVGMPMSGKSSFGKRLSKALDIPFLDLDKQIELYCGLSVKEIFMQEGEERFRTLEREQLQNLVEMNHIAVIACGGGTPAFFDNMQYMLNNGLVIYLKADVELLMQRMNEENKQKRPLLSEDADQKLILDHLYAVRTPFYNMSQLTLRANLPMKSLVETAVAHYNEMKKC
jgi:shikimate kinase